MSTRKLNEAEQRKLDFVINKGGFASFDDDGNLKRFIISYTKYRSVYVEDLGHLNITEEDMKQGLTEEQWNKLYSAYDCQVENDYENLDWSETETDVQCLLIDFLPLVKQ